MILNVLVCVSVPFEVKVNTHLAKESKISSQEVFCNVASERQYMQWSVVSCLSKVKSSSSWERHGDCLVPSASLCIKHFCVCQALSCLTQAFEIAVSRLHVASLVTKIALGSSISIYWCRRCSCVTQQILLAQLCYWKPQSHNVSHSQFGISFSVVCP